MTLDPMVRANSSGNTQVEHSVHSVDCFPDTGQSESFLSHRLVAGFRIFYLLWSSSNLIDLSGYIQGLFALQISNS